MDLPREITTCALCERLVNLDAPHFRVKYVDSELVEEPLRTHCIRPSHWSCYEGWPGRAGLARVAFDAVMSSFHFDPYSRLAWRGDRVALAVTADFYDPDSAVFMFAATGGSVCIAVSEWRDWLGEVDRVLAGRSASERVDLLEVLPFLRRRFPDGSTLTQDLDWDRVKRLVERDKKQMEEDDLHLQRMYRERPEMREDKGTLE